MPHDHYKFYTDSVHINKHTKNFKKKLLQSSIPVLN